MVQVRYHDYEGYEQIIDCEDKEQAERMIEAELETAKLYTFGKRNLDYDYADFTNEDGYMETEIWADHPEYEDERVWVSWIRLWQ